MERGSERVIAEDVAHAKAATEVEMASETGSLGFLDSLVSRVTPWLCFSHEREPAQEEIIPWPATRSSIEALDDALNQNVSTEINQSRRQGSISAPLNQSVGTAINLSRRQRSISAPANQIRDLAGLDTHLPDICASIFAALSSRENEGTYQRCLTLDLQKAGVKVDQEVDITLMYKGSLVGHRRADLRLTTADGQRAIIEMKALVMVAPTHVRQLEFYMHHFCIDRGYLVNFPHESNVFPDVPEECLFVEERLSGMDNPVRKDKSRLENRSVDVIKVVSTASTERAERTPSTSNAWSESYW